MSKSEIDLLINNGIVVTVDAAWTIIDGGSVAVKKDKILNIGQCHEISKQYNARRTIDASNMLVLPGLIDTHHHANPGAMMPGVLDGMDPNIYEYVEKINNNPLTHEYAYIAALASCLVSIKGGVTCVADYAMNPEDEVAALADAGIRGVKAVYLADRIPGASEKDNLKKRKRILENAMDFISKHQENANGRIRTCFGPDTEVVVSKELFKEIVVLANTHHINIHTHVSETLGEVKETKLTHGKRSIEYVYDLGVLKPGTVVGHGCWLSPRDITLLKKSGASVSHAPVSEMLCAAGLTPVPELLEAGVNVSLGRDVQADMFQEIRAALFLPRINHLLDPNLVTSKQVIEMATINGAKALQWENEIGTLEIGKKADIILVNMTKPHISPIIRKPGLNAITLLTSRAVSSDVDAMIVNGNVVMEKGEVYTIDEKKVMKELQAAIENILETTD